MKAIIKILGLGLAVILSVNASFAQDTYFDSHTIGLEIPAVALIDIEPEASKNINMAFSAIDLEAGNPIAASVLDATLWLNVTSIVGTAQTRKVTAEISAGTVPEGTTLAVEAAANAGFGEGTFGAPLGQITLSSTAGDLISGIGSCYTENGGSKGYNITYVWARAAGGFGSLLNFTSTVTITYTLVAVN
ncbi:MAG: hypothetical protein Q7J34_11750 [Bacteroidales bacterium]|nr:hypothetical protein [Bacteroidales bacterium]